MGELAVVGVYGFSDSGKTRLLSAVVPRLTAEGLRVAVVKCSEHAASLDTVGTDTEVLRKAGASVVVFSGPSESAVMVPRLLSVRQVVDVLGDGGLGEVDVVLVEGAREAWIPKIQVGDCPERPLTVARCSGDVDEALRLVHEVMNERKVTRPMVSITVNGKEIPLTEYPELIISKVLLGMLSSLKGVGEVRSARFMLTCCPPHDEG